MGRGQQAESRTQSKTGLDARRLLSTIKPLLGGRDVAAGHSDRYNADPPRSDEEILALCLAAPNELASAYVGNRLMVGLDILVSTDLYSAPSTWKEYRGHIGISSDSAGDPAFVAICSYGPEDGDATNANPLYRD